MYDYDPGPSHLNGSHRMLRVLSLSALLILTALPLAAAEALSFSPIKLFGRMHVLVVHFPVALLTVLALIEALRWRRKSDSPDRTVTLLAILAGAGAVVAAVMGWIEAGDTGWGGKSAEAQALLLHRWLGVTTAVLALVVTALALRRQLADSPRLTLAYRVVLFPAALLVGAAGHFGGVAVHGQDYIDSALPAFLRPAPVAEEPAPPLDPSAKIDFWKDVDPIFSRVCYECHNHKEQKADLRMDSRAALLKGGETGPAIIAGNGTKSLVIIRILGSDGDPRMPKKKPPLSATETEIIKRWIDQGAEWPPKP